MLNKIQVKIYKLIFSWGNKIHIYLKYIKYFEAKGIKTDGEK